MRSSSLIKLGKLAWLEHGQGNFVFSPHSFHAALGLLTCGSGGATRDQLLSFLNCNTLTNLNASASLLHTLLNTNANDVRGITLRSVNGVWADNRFPLRHSFKHIATSLYKAEVQAVDFENKANEAREQMNEWVKKETRGLISTLVPQGSIDNSTRLVLANSLYFKGAWADNFDKSRTKLTEFHLLNGSSIHVPMMTSGSKRYIETFEDFKVLELHYGHHSRLRKPQISMCIFLPHKANGLLDLIDKVSSDPEFLEKHLPCRSEVRVGRFGVPKFKVSLSFEASIALKKLGLDLPFDYQAEFGEMFESEGMGVYVAGVYHNALVEVDEEGTVAAASTAHVICGSALTPPSPHTDFVADHPFMFIIREGVSGAVLFMGWILNPLLVNN